MRLSYLSTRSTVSVRVMEKQGEKSIACSLTTHLLQNQKLPREGGKELVFPPLSLLFYPRTPAVCIHIYTYTYAHMSVRLDTPVCLLPLYYRGTSSLHTCAMLVFHSSSGATQNGRNARRWSLSPARRTNLCVSGFLLSCNRRKFYIYIDRFFPSFHFISIMGGGKIYIYIFITKNRRVATQRIVAREAKVSVRLNAASSTVSGCWMVVTLTGNNKARCRRRVGRIPARLLRDFHVGRYGPFQKEMPRKCLFSEGGGGGKALFRFIIILKDGWRIGYRNVIKIIKCNEINRFRSEDH